LQDYANQVCQMTVGWRLTIADLQILVERRAGRLALDLIRRTSTLDGEAADLTIMGEVGVWLDDARMRDGLPDDLIRSFVVSLDYRVSEEPDGLAVVRSLDLTCESVLVTSDAEFVGRSEKHEIWTRTDPKLGWFIRDR
jgi:hypothetical protein